MKPPTAKQPDEEEELQAVGKRAKAKAAPKKEAAPKKFVGPLTPPNMTATSFVLSIVDTALQMKMGYTASRC